jgi:hypothetical protein
MGMIQQYMSRSHKDRRGSRIVEARSRSLTLLFCPGTNRLPAPSPKSPVQTLQCVRASRNHQPLKHNDIIVTINASTFASATYDLHHSNPCAEAGPTAGQLILLPRDATEREPAASQRRLPSRACRRYLFEKSRRTI